MWKKFGPIILFDQQFLLEWVYNQKLNFKLIKKNTRCYSTNRWLQFILHALFIILILLCSCLKLEFHNQLEFILQKFNEADKLTEQLLDHSSELISNDNTGSLFSSKALALLVSFNDDVSGVRASIEMHAEMFHENCEKHHVSGKFDSL